MEGSFFPPQPAVEKQPPALCPCQGGRSPAFLPALRSRGDQFWPLSYVNILRVT